MIRISAFADEIADDPLDQVRVLAEESIRWVDLRAAWGTNVLDLSEVQIVGLGEIFAEAGIGVAAIASPIGKSSIDEPADAVYDRVKRAIELADRFAARYIRVFSFYGPAGRGTSSGSGPAGPPQRRSDRATSSPLRGSELDRVARDAFGGVDSGLRWTEVWRDEVLSRMVEMARMAEGARMVLVHENERNIYGDTVDRCVDVLESVDSPNLQAAFDPANFIQCGETPFPDAYEVLCPWIDYVHVKDATVEGEVVPAGRGEARYAELLARLHVSDYDGFLALEPHLASQGALSGFSGAELFREAFRALRTLLAAEGWEYE